MGSFENILQFYFTPWKKNHCKVVPRELGIKLLCLSIIHTFAKEKYSLVEILQRNRSIGDQFAIVNVDDFLIVSYYAVWIFSASMNTISAWDELIIFSLWTLFTNM